MLRESTARTRELGAELRQIRENARYTGKELAMRLGWSAAKVSRMETGGGDELYRLLDLAREPDDGYWLQPRPTPRRVVLAHRPGNQALFRATGHVPEDRIEARVRVRMERQRLLRRPSRPQITFYVHENALRTSVGDNQVMHEQLLHMLLICGSGGKSAAGGAGVGGRTHRGGRTWPWMRDNRGR